MGVKKGDEVVLIEESLRPQPHGRKGLGDSSQPSALSTSASEPLQNQVFVSYSSKDREWLDKLQVHLHPLVNSGAITLWDDTKILSGAKWRDEINAALAQAKVALLLVSPDFLASAFINEQELPKLLAAAEHEGLKVLWVPIRFSMYEVTAIEQYQPVHSPEQPLKSLSPSEQDEALVKITKTIQDVLQN